MLIQLHNDVGRLKPRELFYSYSHADEELREELDKRLDNLKQEGFLSTWHDRKILPGTKWASEINANLNRADIILFLVSEAFLASAYCRGVEVRRALERCGKGEAIVVPVILKPCNWISEPFADLEPLPKNCRPVIEWPDTAFLRIADGLRALAYGLMHSPSRDPGTEGLQGQWLLKLKEQSGTAIEVRAERIVSRLKALTNDYNISLEGIGETRTVIGDSANAGPVLILSGGSESFSTITRKQNEGALSQEIGDEVLSFYAINGATVTGSSSLGTYVDVTDSVAEGLLLKPGRKVQASILKGLIIPDKEDDEFHFIIHRGDQNWPSETAKRADYQVLSDYFYSSLAVKGDEQWVNLSAYESDRMIPPELAGTAMGRNLLAQGCMLKRVTASFMHPDSPVGRDYWKEVYARAQSKYGTSKLSFSSFQKVTILPIDALIYNPERGDHPDSPIQVPPDSDLAYALHNHLGVFCDEDLVAKRAGNAVTRDDCNQITLQCFREIVLPKLKEEVNESEYFVDIRRIYSAMLLATWLKRQSTIRNRRVLEVIDRGVAENPFQLKNISPAAFLATSGRPEPRHSPASTSEAKRELSDDRELRSLGGQAFTVPENVEFYREYLKLFKNGLFRCARSEEGDSPGERVIRVYFSGAVDFRRVKLYSVPRWPCSGKEDGSAALQPCSSASPEAASFCRMQIGRSACSMVRPTAVGFAQREPKVESEESS